MFEFSLSLLGDWLPTMTKESSLPDGLPIAGVDKLSIQDYPKEL